MKKGGRCLWLSLVVLTLVTVTSACAQEDEHIEKVRRVLSAIPLFDGHNDLAWAIREQEGEPHNVRAYGLEGTTRGQTDIARLRAGMVGAQFWSVYVDMESVEVGAARVQLEQIDIARQFIREYPEVFEEALTASDVERIFRSGRIGSVLGMEGGHVIENSLGALRAYFDLGVRYMTLTHGGNTDWADSATDDTEHGGLTEFGREVVREMNRLGMLVDLSHVSTETMNDVLDVAEAPVIFSHSGAQGLTDHRRNVPDQVLQRLPENGGVVMVVFYPWHVSEALRTYDGPGDPPWATLSDVADHIEYVRDVAGIDHVGLGADYDGMEPDPPPIGLEDVSKYPALLAELSRRGWSEDALAKLAGRNVLRAWAEAEDAASRIQEQRGPSNATIDELDGGSRPPN
ncbi:MAG TPA: membrane dipeptidase [Gemmatimonadetes bacterium]|nr:membrane dipeptidase [Gemmatimonadota bacterium]